MVANNIIFRFSSARCAPSSEVQKYISRTSQVGAFPRPGTDRRTAQDSVHPAAGSARTDRRNRSQKHVVQHCSKLHRKRRLDIVHRARKFHRRVCHRGAARPIGSASCDEAHHTRGRRDGKGAQFFKPWPLLGSLDKFFTAGRVKLKFNFKSLRP